MRKINPKLKEFVKDCLRDSAWNIGVSHFNVDILYMKDKKDSECECDGIVMAEMRTDRRYLTATLKIYPYVEEKWNKGEKDLVREVIHHEVAHLATQHLRDCAEARFCETGELKDAWETLTTVVGRLSLELDTYKRKEHGGKTKK